MKITTTIPREKNKEESPSVTTFISMVGVVFHRDAEDEAGHQHNDSIVSSMEMYNITMADARAIERLSRIAEGDANQF